MIVTASNRNNQERKRLHEFSQMTARLWEVEIVTVDNALHTVQQLTTSCTLLMLLSGAGTLERDRSVCQMRQDSIYFCPPGSTFGVIGDQQAECSLLVVRFGLFQVSNRNKQQLHAANVEGLFPTEGEIRSDRAGHLLSLCRSMYENFCHRDVLKRWRAQLDCQELLYELMAMAQRETKNDTRQGLERSKEYIEEHFREELTIDRLAEIAGLSPKYFVALFKKTFGISALDHLTQIRMRKAKQLLLCSERLMRDVAHEVGYVDEFYFSRKFKKAVGLSPSAFIKKRKCKVAVYGSTALIGYLMALEVVPFAAPLHRKWSRYYFDLLGADIPVHLDAYRQNHNRSANLDKLAATAPDLIICTSGLEAWEKQRLIEIAPIFEMPAESAGWQQQLRAVAARLDEQAQAERWIAAFEHKTAAVSARIGQQLQQHTILTVRYREDCLYAHCNRGMSDVLFERLGLQSPYPALDTPFDLPLTMEELDASGADHLLLLVWQESGTLDGWKKLQQSPQWLSLEAVRENKLSLISSEPWREYSPIALDRMLDDAALLFSGNCP
ncbi:ABC transporter substrate-binding protein [Tumebacillus algifaecis]|nr:AraC family transcriptional regulator [Tumebacillus algifaecis]